MFGLIPKRIKIADLEVVLTSLGYRVSREPFQIIGFKSLSKKRRLHLKIETFGGTSVPKEAQMDLHIDILSNPMKYHKSIAFYDRISDELELIEETINSAETRVRGGDSLASCPVCKKELAGRFLGSHLKVNHPKRKTRRA